MARHSAGYPEVHESTDMSYLLIDETERAASTAALTKQQFPG